MAGRIRQEINLDNLDKYIRDNVPEIKCPIEVKQVCHCWVNDGGSVQRTDVLLP